MLYLFAFNCRFSYSVCRNRGVTHTPAGRAAGPLSLFVVPCTGERIAACGTIPAEKQHQPVWIQQLTTSPVNFNAKYVR